MGRRTVLTPAGKPAWRRSSTITWARRGSGHMAVTSRRWPPSTPPQGAFWCWMCGPTLSRAGSTAASSGRLWQVPIRIVAVREAGSSWAVNLMRLNTQRAVVRARAHLRIRDHSCAPARHPRWWSKCTCTRECCSRYRYAVGVERSDAGNPPYTVCLHIDATRGTAFYRVTYY